MARVFVKLRVGMCQEKLLFRLTEEPGTMYAFFWGPAVEAEIQKFITFGSEVEDGLVGTFPWNNVSDLCAGIVATRKSLKNLPKGFTAKGYHINWHFRTTAIVLASTLFVLFLLICLQPRLAWLHHVRLCPTFRVVMCKCGTAPLGCVLASVQFVACC